MNRNAILIVVEQFKRGGLETHIESEIRTLSAMGWDVHLALSEFEPGAGLPAGLKGVMTGLDLGPLATAAQLLLAADTLERYIERNHIAAVHCHPFTSCLAAFLAAGKAGVGLAFTLHGPASVGAFYGDVFELFFRRFVLPQSGLVVCVSPEVAQLARLAGTSSATIVLPNPVRLGVATPRARRDGPMRILCASRLDGEKMPGILDFLSKLPADLDWRIDIFGSGLAESELKAFIDASAFQARIDLRGWSETLAAEFPSYDLAVGMGRVVIEAAAADLPAMLIGYDGVKGLIDCEAFESAAYANFSGRGLATIGAEEMRRQFDAVISGDAGLRLRGLVEARYGEDAVWSAFAARLLASEPASRRAIDLLYDALSRVGSSDVPLLQDLSMVSLLTGSDEMDVNANGSEQDQSMRSRAGNGFLNETRYARAADPGGMRSTFDELRDALSSLKSQLGEVQAANDADRRVFERIAQDWHTLGGRLLEAVDVNGANLKVALGEARAAVSQSFDTKADERWQRFLNEMKAQHLREVETLERHAGQRITLLADQAALAADRLALAQAEIATLKDALDAARIREGEAAARSSALSIAQEAELSVRLKQADAEAAAYQSQIAELRASFDAALAEQVETFRNARAQWSANEAALPQTHGPGGVSAASQAVPAQEEGRADRYIIGSLQAQGVALKREIRELRARASLDDYPAPAPATAAAEPKARFGIRGLVSIVLPVYNQANLIDEAIEGVLRQTYSDWELIIVDDGSKDDLHAVLGKYAADRRIRFVRQPNQKLPSALNNGNFFVRGEYMTWTSADNIMLPEQLAELVIALEANPDAGLAYSDYQAIDDRGAPLDDPDWRRHNRPDGSSFIRLPGVVTLENFHQSGDNFLGASFMWRADIQAIVGPYDESTFGGEDYDMWLRMHLVTEFVHVPKVLYQYRVHDNTLNAKAKELDLFKNIRLLVEINQRRREALLGGQNLRPGANGHLRDPLQYDAAVWADREHVGYYELLAKRAEGSLLDDRVRVVEIDAPLRMLDARVLADCDIVVAPDDLTHSWLRRQELPRHIRLLAGDMQSIRPAIDHAIALCHFDRALAAEGHVLATKPYAHAVARAGNEGIALLLQRWGIGGMEQVVLELAAGLARKGANVSLCLVEGGGHERLAAFAKENGFAVVTLDHDVDRLLAYCSSANVGIAHYHHCSFGCRELNGRGVKTVYTLHNSYIWLDADGRQVHGVAIEPMQAYIAVSREAASFGRRVFGLQAPVFVVPNGTDIEGEGATAFDEVSAKLPNPRGDGGFGFLAVGTLTPHKLHDRLIRAFGEVSTRIPGARLTLVGSAQDEGMYRKLLDIRAALPDPSACDILPGVRRQDVITLMKAHHCLVMPSLIEGCSISLLEAVIAGMVCVASDVGAARDLAERTQSVVLTPSPGGDILDMDSARMWSTINAPLKGFEKALARAMAGVVDRFEALDAMAKAAAPEFARTYSRNEMIEAHLRVYQQV